MMFVCISVVCCCCLLSAGVGAFILFNDNANAWFRRTFGMGPTIAAPVGPTTPTGAIPAGAPATQPTTPTAVTTPTCSTAKGYVCPQPWAQTANAAGVCCDKNNATSCLAPEKTMTAANKCGADKFNNFVNVDMANRLPGDVTYGDCPCVPGKKGFVVPYRVPGVKSSQTVSGKACFSTDGALVGVCKPYCTTPQGFPYTDQNLYEAPYSAPNDTTTECCSYAWKRHGSQNINTCGPTHGQLKWDKVTNTDWLTSTDAYTPKDYIDRGDEQNGRWKIRSMAPLQPSGKCCDGKSYAHKAWQIGANHWKKICFNIDSQTSKVTAKDETCMSRTSF